MMSKLTNEMSFHAGYVIAVANVCHLHGDPTIATDVLRELGISIEAVEDLKLTDYDLEALKPLFAQIEKDK